MPDAFLTATDVARLTGKKRHRAQIRVLAAGGYRHIVAATGEPLVRWSDLDEAGKPAQRKQAHRWDLIGSVRNLRS